MGELIRFLFGLGVLAVVLGTIARAFFVETYVVDHNGMAPTLVNGDEVLYWKGASVDMADIMICQHPSRTGRLVMGRAVAFAGHTIETDRNGVLQVDGDRIGGNIMGTMRFYDVTRRKLFRMTYAEIDYAGHHDHEVFMEVGTPFRVPRYEVRRGFYMLGDNRADRDHDSRSFGEIDPAKCLGQVFFRTRAAPDRNDDVQGGMLEIIQ